MHRRIRSSIIAMTNQAVSLSRVSSDDSKHGSEVEDSIGVRILWLIQRYGVVVIAFSSFFPRLFHLQEYVFLGLLPVAVCLSWLEGGSPWVRTPLDVPLIGFLIWVLCTVPAAVDPAYSFTEWKKVLVHVLVFYWAALVLNNKRSAGDWRLLLWAVVAGVFLSSSYAVMDFIARGGTWKDRVIRAGAPSSDYNWLTTYLVMTIPVLMAWLMMQRALWTRAISQITLMVAILAQVLAYTRAGWIAHVVQVMHFGLLTGRRRLLWGSLCVVLMGGIVLAGVAQLGYQRETIDPWTFGARVKTWQLGAEQFVRHPLIGVGYGNDTFRKVYSEMVEADQHKGAEVKVLPALHSTMGMVLMGSGLPALICLCWAFAAGVQHLAAGAQRCEEKDMRLLLYGLIAGIVGFGVRNCFDYMFAGSLAHLCWILLATAYVIHWDAERMRKAMYSQSQPTVVG